MFFMEKELLKNIKSLIESGAIKLILNEKEYQILILYFDLMNKGYSDDKIFFKLGVICKEAGLFNTKIQRGTFYHIFNNMRTDLINIISKYGIDGLNKLYATNMFNQTLKTYNKYYIIKVIIENNLEIHCPYDNDIQRILSQVARYGLDIPFTFISELCLSTKLENTLIRSNIYTIADIIEKNNDYSDFRYMRNFGDKSFSELVDKVHEKGFLFADEHNKKLTK